MKIRDQQAGDRTAIRDVVQAAFATAEHRSGTEGAIVDALRAAAMLTVSLVVDEDGELLGHIAFSPVRIDGRDGGWYGLGPLSVRPDRHKQGIGAALVAEGIARLRALGAQGCVVLGDPGYYGRFGFVQDAGLRLAGVPPQHFLRLMIAGEPARGMVAYHAAFDAARASAQR
ncbi:MAG: N-acetyltransferase [Alphaproteobacteria bacterium]|nr:N-acetyltransferase [Alphaproteobacteria bacterium]